MLPTHDADERGKSPDGAEPLGALVASLNDEFGTSFRLFDGTSGEPIGDRAPEGWFKGAAWDTSASIRAIAEGGQPDVVGSQRDSHRLVLPIQVQDGRRIVAIGDVPALARSAQDVESERARLIKWVRLVHSRVSVPIRSASAPRDDSRNDHLSLSLGAVLELNELLRGLRAGGDTVQFQKRVLHRAAAVLHVEALVWVPAQAEDAILVEGEHQYSKWDCRHLAKLLTENGEWDPSGCLILNQFQSAHLTRRFPNVVNLLALSTCEAEQRGCLIALNKTEAKPATIRSQRPGESRSNGAQEAPAQPPRGQHPGFLPFRRIDAAVLLPFAELLEIGAANARRNAQVQDLFFGLIRSLIAAIDAKDSYTCGHSERVARVAVELAREMNLSETELSDIYLGGLLHDIGKIGISDSVLRKADPLTTEELAQIRQHVYIGCKILADFRAIRHLFPLVLYHHERFDGSGYPEGLKGENIPLHARILAVADSYDAMNSSRSYRPALPRPQIEEILASGRDIQWDGEVIDAFFRASKKIYAIQQHGVGDSIFMALDRGGKSSNYRFDTGHSPGTIDSAEAKTGSSLVSVPGACGGVR